MNYEIVTDSAANLTYSLTKKYDIKVISMKYLMDSEEYDTAPISDDDAWLKEFYTNLRAKKQITTSCINAADFEKVFIEILENGRDFIYLAFSSGLSRTCSIAVDVIEQLKKRFPDRKMYVVDTLAASFGQGLLVDYAARQRAEGKTIEEVYNWQEENKFRLCHQFTVDDLFFLKRGGRISAATAIAGTMLGIKPILHVDNEGHLVNVDKVRGRKQSFIALVDRMEKNAVNPKKQRVFIGHGDCIEDALYVKKLVHDRFGTADFEITYINPIIGAHSGPGTLALFYLGTER